MKDLTQSTNITPLGAGDLIDRAVRFYRGNFWTFVWIAAPPIVVGTLLSVGWTLLTKQIFSVGAQRGGSSEMVGYYLFSSLGGLIIWLTETVATLTVMGGASRNFVRHLLFGEPVTFAATYKNVLSRLGGLIAASTLLAFILSITGVIVFYFGLFIGIIAIMIAAMAFSFSPFIAFIVSLALGLAVFFGTLWLFFLVVSRFAYVPQVMLVEGQGVFAAVGRSASLASGNVQRVAGLFIFTLVATYSALALFYIPLGWYAWASGVEVLSYFSLDDTIPAWYKIASQFLWQTSLILLTPTWMIGLCLLYVDERVRHEGYDIELMAAQRLGEIPAVPLEFSNPLQPALAAAGAPQNSATTTTEVRNKNSMTTLGLK